jgi:U3 small nucleolar RNA-associated protein 5
MSTKRKLPSKLGHPVVKPTIKRPAKDILDESRTQVLGGSRYGELKPNGVKEVVEISSDSSSDDEDEDDEDDEDEDEDGSEAVGAEVNEDHARAVEKAIGEGEDIDMEDPEAREPAVEEQNGPSFGDLLANSSEAIDVAGAFVDSTLQAPSHPQHQQIQPPSGASLGTVLTQALKTMDVPLLESCFQSQDVLIIRATIQRLASPLAGILLQKLAERLHKRPGRAGSLMVWVQWTLVTHGGYLATQSDLIKKLAELNRVIAERARGLQSLLSLKGKLDMLEAQMQLRRAMRVRRRSSDSEDSDAVIYVEGQDDEDQSDTAEASTTSKPNGIVSSSRAPPSDSSSAVSEDMPTTNGIIAESIASSEDEESDASNMIDDEAEETDAESDDEDQVNHSDHDALEDEDESDDAAPAQAAPPTKMQRLGLFSSRRRAA